MSCVVWIETCSISPKCLYTIYFRIFCTFGWTYETLQHTKTIHVYKCMWHRPRTEICSVRKFENAWVRTFLRGRKFLRSQLDLCVLVGTQRCVYLTYACACKARKTNCRRIEEWHCREMFAWCVSWAWLSCITLSRRTLLPWSIVYFYLPIGTVCAGDV